MFERYDEIMMLFDSYLLKKIDKHNFEIKGFVQEFRYIIQEKLGVDLPVIMDGDRQLLHSIIIKYLDTKRKSENAHQIYCAKLRRISNPDSVELKEAEVTNNKKAFDLARISIELKQVCQTYSYALCIVIYNGDITIEILKKLKELNYDGSYGSQNLRLMYKLYIENILNNQELDDLRECRQLLISESIKKDYKIEDYERKIKELEKNLKITSERLNQSNALIMHYKEQLNNEKTYTKKIFSDNNSRIYGK